MTRRAILVVSAQLLADMCKPNPKPHYYEVTQNALPADAKVVGGGYYDSRVQLFTLVVESEAFPEVLDGQPLPTLPPPVFLEHRSAD